MARPKSEEDLQAYLKDHLKYERDMLGFTFGMLSQSAGLRWCAMFESFGVHARNLYDFLRHEGRGNTIRADDYVPGRQKPAASNVSQKMNSSFFHLSTSRLKDQPVNLADAADIGDWIDKEWMIWAGTLKAPFKPLVDASPVCASTTAPLSTVSTTNHVTSTSIRF